MKCNHQSKLNLSQDDYLYSLLRIGEFCYVYNLPQTSQQEEKGQGAESKGENRDRACTAPWSSALEGRGLYPCSAPLHAEEKGLLPLLPAPFPPASSGQSGLRERVMRRLQDDGFACAAVDVVEINTDVITIEQWYVKLINKLVEEFNLQAEFNSKTWWQKNSLFSPVLCFNKFIETIVLPKVNNNIVIFVDKIDSILSLAFNSDDFLAVIRDCYNRRAYKPEYKRITFASLGFSMPYDLIQDKKRTPFNIGRVIDFHLGMNLGK